MTKFLDQNSLSYFWTKIKAYFAKKTEVLQLTGGTLTGALGIYGNSLYLKSTSINRDASTPSANIVGPQLIFQDKDGERVGFVRVDRETDGYNKLKFYVYGEDSNGDETYNGLVIGVDRSGNRMVAVSSSAAWRTGIGLGTVLTGGTAPTGSTKDATSRASGATYQINITVTSPGANYVPVAICAVSCNNANAVSRGFDLDGISYGSNATLKTYWRANAAISANAATYSAQVYFTLRTTS